MVIRIFPIIDIRAILMSVFYSPVFVGSRVFVFKIDAMLNYFPNWLI